MTFHLETDRLILREIHESDIEGIFELDSNPEVHKYLGKNPITTFKQAEENITFIQEQYKERGIGRFACIEKSSGDFMGWSGLKLNQGEKESLNGFTNFIDIGYRFIPRFWGKGYASESAFACLGFGFKEMKYDIIYGAADLENVGSNKILQKIGLLLVNKFDYEGVDVNWYALKKTDYER
ncbi:Ribosomal-protein-alanine N-acetyltransferase [Tenacibaculum sediminilitoris]|uniref:GNAT family N-acetyltransferase n=1 Tax=Tenacibaculum sediminilitoris TaxID=1820334 RepID=UPI003893C1D1